ncbi:MAG: hypothetical protein Q9186_001150 [Xanthomendoza sp. 1 TL-2023]
MSIIPPPTPPSSAPTSPTHPASPDGNCVIDVGDDPEKNEKNGYDGAYSDSSPSSTAATGGMWIRGRNAKSRPNDELAEMEKALIAMDDEDEELDQLALESRRRDDQRPEEPSRKSLITKIDDKLKAYGTSAICRIALEELMFAADDLVMRIRRNVAIPRPLDRDYGSLYKWIDDTKPLCREETKFIKYQDDMIALAEKQEGGWFDGMLEDALSIFPRQVTRFILSSAEERKKSDDEYVQLYSKYRVDFLARLILTVVAVVLLMVPTAVLFLVQEHAVLKIMLIMLFTMLFSAALSLTTKAKRHEMFAASAA